MVALLLAVFLVISIIPAGAADPCQETACINVYTDNNQIIIEAHKGNTTVKKSIAQAPKKPVVKQSPKPKAVPLFFPPTKPKLVVVKPTVKRTYKPRVKKAVTKVNLSDKLTKMVPTAGVAYQPEFEPLVHVPVYFWCDLPSLFQSRVDIIGEVVDVALRPSFVWSFGDGSVFATTENGAPYPTGPIHHTYAKPGNYVVTLLTTWNGTYTHNAEARAVSGTVKKITVAAITIVQAPTHFKG
ncbi:PKD domain containing protein [Candidatus Nanopelagicaceae bacterium]